MNRYQISHAHHFPLYLRTLELCNQKPLKTPTYPRMNKKYIINIREHIFRTTSNILMHKKENGPDPEKWEFRANDNMEKKFQTNK